jgi:hypothetical protein
MAHVYSSAHVLLRFLGYSQPIIPIATGMLPHTSAEGLKMDPINIAVVANAATSGHNVGVGTGSRKSAVESNLLSPGRTESFHEEGLAVP